MRNPVLSIAIAFVLVAPCTAFAGGKSKGIEVNSFSWGGANQGTAGTSGGGGAASGRSMPVTKNIDKSSPTLMMQSSSPGGGKRK